MPEKCHIDCDSYVEDVLKRSMKLPCRDCNRRPNLQDHYSNGKCPNCGAKIK